MQLAIRLLVAVTEDDRLQQWTDAVLPMAPTEHTPEAPASHGGTSKAESCQPRNTTAGTAVIAVSAEAQTPASVTAGSVKAAHSQQSSIEAACAHGQTHSRSSAANQQISAAQQASSTASSTARHGALSATGELLTERKVSAPATQQLQLSDLADLEACLQEHGLSPLQARNCTALLWARACDRVTRLTCLGCCHCVP